MDYKSDYTGVLEIPAMLDGLPVTAIGYQVFIGKPQLTGVVIPEGVKAIGYHAFVSCNGIKSIKIPDSVEYIGGGAFSDCRSLRRIEVSKEHKYFAVIQGALYEKAGRKLLALPAGLNRINFDIPEGTLAIGDGVLAFNYALLGVTIPDSVTSIGRCAFFDCPFLTSVEISKNVNFIDEGVFSGCDRLRDISVSAENGSYSVINGALCDKSGETLIYLPSGLCAVSYAIPEGVKTICEYAFRDCALLKNVTMPDCVTEIGDSAFMFTPLKRVIIPKNVTRIGKNAFGECNDLESVILSDGVTEIGESSFANCKSLSSVVIPDSVTGIGEKAFSYCVSLKEMNIPDSVTYIGKEAFFACFRLTVTVNKGSFAEDYIKNNTSIKRNTLNRQ